MIDQTSILEILPTVVKRMAIDRIVGGSLEFYPTGSRFFGGARADSDWDFYCLDSEQTRLYLGNLGFRSTSVDAKTGYDDITVVDVYRHCLGDTQIDVQLCSEQGLLLKQRVQKFLRKQYPIGLPGDKTTNRHIWHVACALLATA